MENVTYGKCIMESVTYGIWNYGKYIMENETEPWAPENQLSLRCGKMMYPKVYTFHCQPMRGLD